MRSFIRQKTIYCGEEYREVDIFPYSTAQHIAIRRGQRSKKEKVTEPKQRNLNDKNARRYLVQLGNLNFGEEDLHVTATYSAKHLPGSVAEAERTASNYLRRVQYRRKKEGLPPLKYILVTAYSTGKDGEKPTRIHHHIIMNGGLDRDLLELMWTRERINWNRLHTDKKYKAGLRRRGLGFINADRLQPDENGIAALCAYLAKNPSGKKRWSSSQNLKKPYSRNNDTRFNRRQVEKLAKEHPPRSYWEKMFPGWTPTGDDYGVTTQYNDRTGWSIYLKLRRREWKRLN